MPSFVSKSLLYIICTLLAAALPALAAGQDADSVSLADVPTVQERIREERTRGNAEQAWEMEQNLLQLVVENPDRVESARILRDVADYRINVLLRYDADEFPQEIVLGCYYNAQDSMTNVRQRGSQPVAAGQSANALNQTCATGSRRIARRTLAAEALSFYVDSVRVFLRANNAVSDETHETIMKLLDACYLNSNYSMGRQTLESLRSRQDANGASARARALTLVHIGDWDMLFAEHFGSRYASTALEFYEQAIELLAQSDVDAGVGDSLFSAQTPVLLPASTGNDLASSGNGSAAYVELSFEIRDNGRSGRIEVLDTSTATSRDAQRDAENAIRQGRFRPVVESGRLLDSATATARYYTNN